MKKGTRYELAPIRRVLRRREDGERPGLCRDPGGRLPPESPGSRARRTGRVWVRPYAEGRASPLSGGVFGAVDELRGPDVEIKSLDSACPGWTRPGVPALLALTDRVGQVIRRECKRDPIGFLRVVQLAPRAGPSLAQRRPSDEPGGRTPGRARGASGLLSRNKAQQHGESFSSFPNQRRSIVALNIPVILGSVRRRPDRHPGGPLRRRRVMRPAATGSRSSRPGRVRTATPRPDV